VVAALGSAWQAPDYAEPMTEHGTAHAPPALGRLARAATTASSLLGDRPWVLRRDS
jgi:hypothetical protein